MDIVFTHVFDVTIYSFDVLSLASTSSRSVRGGECYCGVKYSCLLYKIYGWKYTLQNSVKKYLVKSLFDSSSFLISNTNTNNHRRINGLKSWTALKCYFNAFWIFVFWKWKRFYSHSPREIVILQRWDTHCRNSQVFRLRYGYRI